MSVVKGCVMLEPLRSFYQKLFFQILPVFGFGQCILHILPLVCSAKKGP